MSRLALHGGRPVIEKPLGVRWPIFDENEEREILAALRSGKWCRLNYSAEPDQSKVAQFEEAFTAYQGGRYALALTNGTQALECALKAGGVGPGDEVIVPALTFVATALAVALIGAIPVMVDVDAESFNLSPEAAAAAITPRTKALLPVHNGGYPADMDAIMALAQKHNLLVIEDCAHAHGSQWRGQGVGTLGHLGTFSFQQGKTISAGEGGMVVTNDERLAGRAYAHHHIGRVAGRPFEAGTGIVGGDQRMTEFQGAVLLAQMRRFPDQVAIRERNTAHLAQGMEQIPGVRAIRRDPRVTRWCFYYWNFHYLEDEFEGVPRERFIEALRAEGVPVQVGAHGGPIYKLPSLRDSKTGIVQPCPTAEHLAQHEALSITHSAFLGPVAEMDLILAAMQKVRDHAAELRADGEREPAAG